MFVFGHIEDADDLQDLGEYILTTCWRHGHMCLIVKSLKNKYENLIKINSGVTRVIFFGRFDHPSRCVLDFLYAG